MEEAERKQRMEREAQERRIGIESLSQKIPGPEGYLRDALLHNLYVAGKELHSLRASLARLEADSSRNYDREAFHRDQILKFMSIEVQALVGLASLQSGASNSR